MPGDALTLVAMLIPLGCFTDSNRALISILEVASVDFAAPLIIRVNFIGVRRRITTGLVAVIYNASSYGTPVPQCLRQGLYQCEMYVAIRRFAAAGLAVMFATTIFRPAIVGFV